MGECEIHVRKGGKVFHFWHVLPIIQTQTLTGRKKHEGGTTMKKTLSLILATLMLLTSVALASGDSTDALDAFYALTGKTAQTTPTKTSAEYLASVMAGAYSAPTADTAAALAADLLPLTSVTTRDMAAYASANKLTVTQVRNSYYKALANVLKADILVNPAAEESAKNLQTILSLFLDKSDDGQASRETIRTSMTKESAATLAASYQLPQHFVEFVIMNEDWDDDDWTNDDAWKLTYTWGNIYEDSLDDLVLGSRDSASSTRVAQLQERLIALGYLSGKADGVFGEKTQAALIQYQRANGMAATGIYDDSDDDWMISTNVVARWDYEDSFIDTPDNTPDNTPDRRTTTTTNTTTTKTTTNSNTTNTTRNNTRDNTPDNTPDNTRDNTPDRDNS